VGYDSALGFVARRRRGTRTMTTTTITRVLGLLCAGGLLACDKSSTPATEVPGAASPAAGENGGECLHSEGCCGGHTEGDGSCGQDEAAEPASPTAHEPRHFEWTIAPGKFAEINVELGDDAHMSATFRSDAPLSWNIHSHVGNEATIHAKGSAAEGAPAFAAETSGLYSYLWVNETEQPVNVTVDLRISGTGRVHSTHP
jgi:hypothetical protein